MSNYKEIMQAAKQEKQKAELNTSMQADKDTSMEIEETVNLCVRVSKAQRKRWKAWAVAHDISLADLVEKAVEAYVRDNNNP